MTLGNKIRRLREFLGLSQIEVANTIDVSKQTLYKYEHDIVTNIPSDKIEALAHALNTTPAYLMGWEDEEDDITRQDVSSFDPEVIGQAMFLYELYRKAPPKIQAAVETLLTPTKSDS